MVEKLKQKLLMLKFKFFLMPEVKEFIDINRKFWLQDKKKNKKNLILIEGYMSTPTYLLQSARLAKTLEYKTDSQPLLLTKGICNQFINNAKFYYSFGIKEKKQLEKILFNPLNIIKSIQLMVQFFRKFKEGNQLLRLKINNLLIGDLIYDTIIRNNKNIFTIDKIKYRYVKYILKAYLLFFAYEKLLKSYNFEYVIVSHRTYINCGILSRLAHDFDIPVVVSKPRRIRVYKDDDIRNHTETPTEHEFKQAQKQEQKLIKESQQYLKRRFKGEINQHDVKNAFVDKILYNKKDLNIKNRLPIVFVMAHVFSDDPHGGKWQIFKDYYTWFNETIKIISEIKKVNWIVKPHPSAFMYGEEGVVERIVRQNKKNFNNIYLAPQDLNTSSIKDIANAIVTVGGTAGLEFSCFGVPSVIASKTFYSGHGFTIEPRTEKEYKDILSNINEVSKLDREQIRKARFILGVVKINNVINDPLLPLNYITPADNTVKRKKEAYKTIINNLRKINNKEQLFIKLAL